MTASSEPDSLKFPAITISTEQSVEAVEEKLNWATQLLKKADSVEQSIHICQLIKTCAETLTALKKLNAQMS